MNEFSLLDWKRKIFEIYSKVRNEENPEFSWNKWVYNRKNLFENHSATDGASGSPIDPRVLIYLLLIMS